MTDSLCRKRKLADSFIPCGKVHKVRSSVSVALLEFELVMTGELPVQCGQLLKQIGHYL